MNTRRDSRPAVSAETGPDVVAGRFRLMKRLGSHPAGRVFLAEDSRDAKLVALKLLPLGEPGAAPDNTGPDGFAREAIALRRLEHPDIVSVFDAGRSGAWGWVSMEAVAGCDLSRYARRDKLLPERVVARVGARIARALDHAHRCGVVHRDVKPANVLVDWRHAVVKLGDFGIARWPGLALTRSGQLPGSPDYMAPEQLAGVEVGPAADVYALGVTLFELLCGRRPFTASTLGGLLHAVAHEPPPDLQLLQPELPVDLCRLIRSALAKLPVHRPVSAGAFAAALERVATGAPAADA